MHPGTNVAVAPKKQNRTPASRHKQGGEFDIEQSHGKGGVAARPKSGHEKAHNQANARDDYALAIIVPVVDGTLGVKEGGVGEMTHPSF